MEGKDGVCDMLFFICSLLRVSEMVRQGNRIGIRREHWNEGAACMPIMRMIFLIQLRSKQTRDKDSGKRDTCVVGAAEEATVEGG